MAGAKKKLPPASFRPEGYSRNGRSFTKARANAPSADDDLADLDHRRDVGVILDVAHDLLAVLAHSGLKGLQRINEDVAHPDIGRGRAGSAARKSLINRVIFAGLAEAVFHQ